MISSTVRVGGKRRFSGDTIGRVDFARGAQRCGFSLAEIRDLLDDTSSEPRQIVDDKITELRARQDEIATMVARLEELKACGCEAVSECPAIARSSATS